MKIFVSWSGESSRKIAELIKAWLPYVIQDVDVWVSSQDIGKGERWQLGVSEGLAQIDFGLLILTKDNSDAPRVLFEAGALSKLVSSRLIPILCGVDRLDLVKSPLSQFQYAEFASAEIFSVVQAINQFSPKPIPEDRLSRSFAKWWPELESEYKKIDIKAPAPGTASKSKTEHARLDNIELALEVVLEDLKNIGRKLNERQLNDLEVYRKMSNRNVGIEMPAFVSSRDIEAISNFGKTVANMRNHSGVDAPSSRSKETAKARHVAKDDGPNYSAGDDEAV